MSQTTYPPEDNECGAPIRGVDGRFRYPLGYTTAGHLTLRTTRQGLALDWTVKEGSLDGELYLLMQASRTLGALRAGRRPSKKYHPIAQEEANEANGNIRYFLCILAADNDYQISPRAAGGEQLWARA